MMRNKKDKSIGWWLRFCGFIGGIVLAGFGWFLDHPANFPKLMSVIAPEASAAAQILDRLAGDEKVIIPTTDPGAKFLIQRWSGLPQDVTIIGIGRSAAFLQFGSEVTNDIELHALVDSEHYIEPAWRMSAARRLVDEKLNGSLILWSSFITFGGLLISAVIGIYELLAGK
ncbi:MAG TPA: hypothetical protein VFF49_09280 [Thermodesulfobacteriota bacterium]|nr:hypothetical protein [Thermodesulfobacteriota bacterium]